MPNQQITAGQRPRLDFWHPTRIRQPTLVLAGTDDPIIPLINARIMSRLLPDATLHVYDEGHLGLLTKAPELGDLVSRFLLDETHRGPR